SAVNLNRLLENLLEWSRMEQGLIPFYPQKSKLLPLVKESISALQDEANKKRLKIQTTISEDITIYADHHILQSVIRNVLSNAVKFTPRDGTIKIEAREDSKNTVVSITDTGIGMDTKILNNLFKLDVRTNRNGTENEPSTGLGLILCKEFVEKHNGKIWVESEVNKGTTFYFSFPHAIT
ncbi:MAG TPA: HAMP domain-containing sensor histidine kinase, partial [Flavobacterium sp.]|uniref:sensor histidine kinase n=1 Tax=Flavobacterium sp. TaxID=239 RepID=UPI002DB68613